MLERASRLLPSVLTALACVIISLTRKSFYFDTDSDISDHFLYSFTHANIFHLSLNLIALFQFKPRWKTLIIGYASCVVASFIPVASMDDPTCGLSGLIMGCYARRYHSYKTNILWIVLSNLLMAFVPFVNWRIHIISFLIAYVTYHVLHERRVH